MKIRSVFQNKKLKINVKQKNWFKLKEILLKFKK